MEWKLAYTLVVFALGCVAGWMIHVARTKNNLDRVMNILGSAISRNKHEFINAVEDVLELCSAVSIEESETSNALYRAITKAQGALNNWRDE